MLLGTVQAGWRGSWKLAERISLSLRERAGGEGERNVRIVEMLVTIMRPKIKTAEIRDDEVLRGGARAPNVLSKSESRFVLRRN